MSFKADAPFPTVIIVDSKGKIIYLNEAENYRVRPGADELLSVLK